MKKQLLKKEIPAIYNASGNDCSPEYYTFKDDYKSASFYNYRKLMLSIIEFVRQIS